jgi:predicted CopG family antitoxin
MSTTTIQIDKTTLEKLKKIKKEMNSPNYDEVINYLIEKELNLPESLFGFMKGKTNSFVRESEEYHEI